MAKLGTYSRWIFIMKYGIYTLPLLAILLSTSVSKQSLWAQPVGHGPHDTIRVWAEILPNGDTIPVSILPDYYAYSVLRGEWKEYYKEWKRLKNAVYVTYPYALKAATIINTVNKQLVGIDDRRKRRAIIRSHEKELRTEFSDRLKNLSVYQGKVLMKLINRQTGETCYEILEEYKGSIPTAFYQGIAFIFGSSLKQGYNPLVDKRDRFIEIITRDLEYKYGYYQNRNTD